MDEDSDLLPTTSLIENVIQFKHLLFLNTAMTVSPLVTQSMLQRL